MGANDGIWIHWLDSTHRASWGNKPPTWSQRWWIQLGGLVKSFISFFPQCERREWSNFNWVAGGPNQRLVWEKLCRISGGYPNHSMTRGLAYHRHRLFWRSSSMKCWATWRCQPSVELWVHQYMDLSSTDAPLWSTYMSYLNKTYLWCGDISACHVSVLEDNFKTFLKKHRLQTR